MSADKVVTHADRNILQDARRWVANVPCHQEAEGSQTRLLDLFDRLLAAAEADVPPLPEGWVLLDDPGYGDGPRVVWHRAGCLFIRRDDVLHWGTVAEHRNNLTPLRPTVTEANVERGARAGYAAYMTTFGVDPSEWDGLSEESRTRLLNQCRAAFKAAGIEVAS